MEAAIPMDSGFAKSFDPEPSPTSFVEGAPTEAVPAQGPGMFTESEGEAVM